MKLIFVLQTVASTTSILLISSLDDITSMGISYEIDRPFNCLSRIWIDLPHKSHNASDKYPTMHYFVTEMGTYVPISVTKWCIVGFGLVHCGICEMGLLSGHEFGYHPHCSCPCACLTLVHTMATRQCGIQGSDNDAVLQAQTFILKYTMVVNSDT